VNIGANTLTIGSTTAITGQTKAGTVAIGGTNVNLTGTGAINVVAGTFVASGGTGATYDAGSINLASGTTFRSDTGAIINARIVSNGGNIRFTATTTPRAASIEGSGTLFIGSATDNTNSPLEVGSNNLSTTFSGVVRNTDSGGTGRTGSLTKVGDGVLTLTGVNLYTGGTNVRGGTLLANTAATGTNSATGTGAVVVGGFTTGAGPFVQNDAVGTLGGTGRIAGAVTVNQGGIIAPGPLVVAGTVGTLTVASPVTLGAAGTGLNAVPTLAVKLTASDNTSLTDDSDVLALTGVGAAGVLNISSPDALNLLPLTAITTPTTYTIATFASLDPALPTFENVLINGVVAQSLDSNLANYALVTFNSNNIQVTVNNLAAIPEPATAGLLGLAAGGLLARRRRALR
jgi:autotransporter-associated beta strand protein